MHPPCALALIAYRLSTATANKANKELGYLFPYLPSASFAVNSLLYENKVRAGRLTNIRQLFAVAMPFA
jgi:hypothetical protein